MRNRILELFGQVQITNFGQGTKYRCLFRIEVLVPSNDNPELLALYKVSDGYSIILTAVEQNTVT